MLFPLYLPRLASLPIVKPEWELSLQMGLSPVAYSVSIERSQQQMYGGHTEYLIL